jgi:hypothetical protein
VPQNTSTIYIIVDGRSVIRLITNIDVVFNVHFVVLESSCSFAERLQHVARAELRAPGAAAPAREARPVLHLRWRGGRAGPAGARGGLVAARWRGRGLGGQ